MPDVPLLPASGTHGSEPGIGMRAGPAATAETFSTKFGVTPRVTVEDSFVRGSLGRAYKGVCVR
jgi:hypothetical protein